jgi:hypothetical protein
MTGYAVLRFGHQSKRKTSRRFMILLLNQVEKQTAALTAQMLTGQDRGCSCDVIWWSDGYNRKIEKENSKIDTEKRTRGNWLSPGILLGRELGSSTE